MKKAIAYLVPCAIFTLLLETFLCFRSAFVKRDLYNIQAKVVNSPCVANHENDDQIIHIDCPIEVTKSFEIPPEFHKNIGGFKGVFFEIQAEMYQKPIGKSKDWYPYLAMHNEEIDHMPYINFSGRKFATHLKAGSFLIDAYAVSAFKNKRQLKLIDDHVYNPSKERPPKFLNSDNTQVYNDALYSGDPEHPILGDVRIRFFGSTATHISAIGVQRNLSRWHSLQLYDSTKALKTLSMNNKQLQVLFASEGDLKSSELIAKYEPKVNKFLAIQNYTRYINTILLIIASYMILVHGKPNLSYAARIGYFMVSTLFASAIQLILRSSVAFIYSWMEPLIMLPASLLLTAITVVAYR